MTPVVLGVESSCDETGVAIVRGRRILGEAVASSAELQARFGGVVPEVAARQHVVALPALVAAVLEDSALTPDAIDAVAVTVGPGLLGALLVGISAAKSLAVAWQKPLIGVHHLEAHLYANAVVAPIRFPALALLVSGGHTGLWLWRRHGDLRQLAETRDDAAGEALDKGARLLGLPYPGGPHLERLARTADPARRVTLPIASVRGDAWAWSFSGLKTALARGLEEQPERRAEWARALEEAVVEALVTRVDRAFATFPVPRVYLAGGVAANQRLRDALKAWADARRVALYVPPLRYCTDNGVMVALAGAAKFRRGRTDSLAMAPRTPYPLGEPLLREDGRVTTG
jgi:N6-L-threonylcarbamoyladenine synthase